MNAKEFLSRYLQIRNQIESKEEQLAYFRSLATRITTVLSGMPHANGLAEGSSARENATIQIVLLCNEIEEDLVVMKNVFQEISDVIKAVQNNEARTILEYKYLSGWSWSKIFGKFPGCKSTIMGYHRNGLRAVDEILKVKEGQTMSYRNGG